MVELILIVSMIVLFIVIGIFLMNGKGAFLIAGYNTMSKEEKEEYDEVALCQFVGKIMFTFGFIMVIFLISDVFEMNWLFYFALALTMILTILMIVYANTRNRFKKK